MRIVENEDSGDSVTKMTLSTNNTLLSKDKSAKSIKKDSGIDNPTLLGKENLKNNFPSALRKKGKTILLEEKSAHLSVKSVSYGVDSVTNDTLSILSCSVDTRWYESGLQRGIHGPMPTWSCCISSF